MVDEPKKVAETRKFEVLSRCELGVLSVGLTEIKRRCSLW